MSRNLSAKIDFSQINFLIVEPDEIATDLTKGILNMLGARSIRQCSTTNRALQIMRADPIDIIITEWRLKPLSGLEFVDFIRKDPNSANRMVHVIMLTAYSEKEYIVTARDHGVTEFLAKPFTVDTLYRRLVSVVAYPRQFVRTSDYFGPDRRRVRRDWAGVERRINTQS